MQLDYVWVVQLLQQRNLSECSLRIGGVLEGIEYFFEGEGVASLLVSDFPDVSVGSTADLLLQAVSLEDVGFDLLCHSL